MGNHRVDLDLAVHVPVNNFRHFGASLGTAKGRAAPDSAGNQLERAGRNFSPRRCHDNNDRFSSALVRRLKRRAHHIHITRRIKGIVRPSDFGGFEICVPEQRLDQPDVNVFLDQQRRGRMPETMWGLRGPMLTQNTADPSLRHPHLVADVINASPAT